MFVCLFTGASSFSIGGGYEAAPSRPPLRAEAPRRDSLDMMMDQRPIPGLENHYNSRKPGSGYSYGNNNGSSRGSGSGSRGRQAEYDENEPMQFGGQRAGGRGPMSSGDYAASLREQINEKKRLDSMDAGRYGSGVDNGYKAPSFDRRGSRQEETMQNYSDSMPSQRTTRGPMSQADYAASLKAQIEEKKRYDQEDPSTRRLSFLRSDENNVNQSKRRYQIEEVSSVKGNKTSGSTKYMQVSKDQRVIVPSVKVHNPPGGASSFSLGWM